MTRHYWSEPDIATRGAWNPVRFQAARRPDAAETDSRFDPRAPGFSSFVLDDDVVYHVYSTTSRELEFLMGYYPILDHAPKGRDEGDSFQTWIRRRDEYE
jgi:predicted dithiol-disulfide oxidoreductase (DUF899 family)